MLVCYTDGVTESRGAGGLFGERRLIALLEGATGATAATVADRITEAVLEFQDGRAQDDLALLVLRATGR